MWKHPVSTPEQNLPGGSGKLTQMRGRGVGGEGVAMQRYEVWQTLQRPVVSWLSTGELRYGNSPGLQTSWLDCDHLHLERHTWVSTQNHMLVFVPASASRCFLLSFCLGSHKHQPSYLLLAPRSLQLGVQTSMSVTILSSSPVHVSADITHGNQMLAMNSTTVGGGQSFWMSPNTFTELLEAKWLLFYRRNPAVDSASCEYLRPRSISSSGQCSSPEAGKYSSWRAMLGCRSWWTGWPGGGKLTPQMKIRG